MTYPIDTTGLAGTNFVTGESHLVSTTAANSARLIFPLQGLFFSGSSLVVVYTDLAGGQRQLEAGVDYQPVFEMKGVSTLDKTSIFAALKLLDSTLAGTFELEYQTLGGEWIINQGQILQYLRDNSFNPQIAYTALALIPEQVYPGTSEEWLLNSISSVLLAQSRFTKPMIGVTHLPLPADEQIFLAGAALETGNGTLVNRGGSTSSTGGSSGGSSGGVVSGTVSITNQSLLAKDSSLQQILSTLKATSMLTGTLWADRSLALPVYYVRKEVFNETTGVTAIAWETPTGDAVTPPNVSALVPADGDSNTDITNTSYIATASGVGYAANDLLVHSFGINPNTSPASLLFSLWLNVTTGQVLSTAPAAANVEFATPSAQTAPSMSNYALENGGNLASISAEVASLGNAQGSIGDAAYAGSGNGTVIGILKGVYSQSKAIVSGIASLVAGQRLSSSTDSVTIVSPSTLNVASPSGALALDSTVQAVSTAISAQSAVSVSVFSDNTVQPPVYYIRRETNHNGTPAVVWTLLDGTTATPVLSKLTASSAPVTSTPLSAQYLATAGGNGYSQADLLIHSWTINASTTPATITSSVWLNATTNALLSSAPAAGTYSLVQSTGGGSTGGGGTIDTTGLALSTKQPGLDATDNGALSHVTNFPAVQTVAFDTAPHVIVDNLPATQSVSGTVTANVQGGNATAVKTDSSNTVQPISATNLPLPSNAAQETGGNLATIASNVGTPNEVAYSGSGSGTLISLLKGIYAKVASNLNIRALSSATDSVKVEGGNATAVKVDGSATTQPISAANLPLPTGAATESGNLATIATKATATASASGTPTDAAYSGTGSGTLISLLKGLYSQLSSTLNTRTLSSATDTVKVEGGNIAPVKVDGSATTQPVSGTITANVGATNGLALDSSIQSLISTIKSTTAIQGTVWADNSTAPPTYYVRRESVNEGTGAITITWETTAGSIATPTITNLTPADADQGLQAESILYTATASGTGYTSGDILIHCYAVNTALSTPTMAYSFWFNAGPSVVGGAVLSVAPLNGTYTLESQAITASSLPLPSNAAQETGGHLAAIDAVQGTQADVVYSGSGNSTVMGVLKGIYAKVAGVVNTRTLSSSTDTVKVEGGNTASVKVDGSAVTQPVSLASQPLPTGAATETGNLATIATAAGSPADTPYAGSGSSSIVSALKGIYAAIKGTLSIRALSSATDTVKVEGGNATAVKTDGSAVVQPISATALPLPSNAAQETGGHLANIDGTIGSTSDVAYSGTGSGTLITMLKGIYAKLSGTLTVGGTVTIGAGSNAIGTVQVSNLPVTQAISATSLPLPAGAATESGNLATVASNTGSVSTATGTTSDTAYSGAATGTVISILKGIYSKVASTLTVSGTVTANVQGGNATAVKVDGSASTQPISAVSLPLPTGAALENGNLANVATTTGNQADAAYTGTGSSSVVAALKGIYAKLAGTLTTTTTVTSLPSLPAGANAIGSVSVSNFPATQAVSGTVAVSNLPATQAVTGTVTANIGSTNGLALDGTDATGVTPPTGGVGIRGWLSGIYSKLSGTLSVNATSLPLPSNAAKETGGNLDVLAGAIGATENVPATGTGYLGWLSDISAALNNLFVQQSGGLAITSLPAAQISAITDSQSLAYNVINTSTPVISALPNSGSVLLYISGTWVGSLIVQVGQTVTGIYEQVPVSLKGGQDGTFTYTPITANGVYRVAGTAGSTSIKVSAQTLSSGTPRVVFGTSASAQTVEVVQLNPANLQVTVQGGNSVAVKTDGSAVTQPVSATALPLPSNAAQETGGNLASIATSNSTIAAAQGTSATGVTQPTGGSGILGWLSGIYNKLNGTVAVTGTFWQATQPVSGTVSVSNLPTTQTVAGTVAVSSLPALPAGANAIGTVSVSNLPATQTVAGTVTANIGTTNGLALDSSIQTLINTVKSTVTISGTVWYDQTVNPPVYYVRKETVNEGTGVSVISWETPGGSVATPTVANLAAVSNAQNLQNENITYSATSSGTGYSTNDILIHAYGIDTTLSTPAVAYSFWFNATTGEIISAPVNGTYSNASSTSVTVTSSVLPAGAATAANQPALNGDGGALAHITNFPATQAVSGTITANVGTTNGLALDGTDATGVTAPTGGVGIRGWLSGIYSKLSNPLAVTGTFWQATQPVSGTVAVSNFPATQAVSAAALPLPSGAATETGNLATVATSSTTIATAQGSAGTGIAAPTGGAGILGFLSGIYKALTTSVTVSVSNLPTTQTVAGTVAVSSLPSLPAGANAIGSVTVTSSSLPTGAAQETGGNLAAISTATGAATDTAWGGTGASTVIAALKGIYGKLASTLTVSGTVTANVQGGNATAVKVDGSATVQPISAASLPLPTGAATETGNLAAIASSTASVASAQGVAGTGISAPTGGSGVLGFLSGIYKALTGTVAVSGTFWQATQPVSAASLPLPTGAAQETGGNLATTATQVTNLNTVTGTISDTAWAGTGNSTVVAALKAIYGKLAGTVAVTGTVAVSNFPNTQAISASSLPLPTGAATEGGNLATIASAQGVGGTSISQPTGGSGVLGWLSGIYSKLSNPLSVTGTFWQATQPISAASLPLPTGAAQETGGNLATVATQTTSLSTVTGGQSDVAFTGGTGASTISAMLRGIFNKLAGTLTVSGTVNVQGGNATAVKVDGSGVVQPISASSLPLPTGAAQETGGNLAAINAATGTTADTAWAGNGTSTVIAALKGIYTKLGGTLTVGGTVAVSSLPALPAGANAIGSVSVSNFPATQAVSATALPLPAGAATETGNLAAISTATGTTADTAWTGTGSSTVISALKAIYGKLAGGVAVTGTFWQATQPVSATSLPLPTGAATETGNLATIATAQGGGATGVTMPTGGTGIMGWLSGIYSKLSSPLAVTGTFYQATQPVSATSLPLPTGAATESGNLATVATNTSAANTNAGSLTDTAYTGGASGSLNAILKGVFTKLSGTLSVTGTFYQATQPVSAVSLPLPSNAAQETGGNLATIASAQGTSATGVTQLTGGAGILGWLSAIYNRLNTTVAVTGTFWQATQPVSGTVAVSSLPALPAGANAIGSVSVSNFPATQAISASALPLPAGAATETGNLATVATNTGATTTQVTNLNTATGGVADTAYAGSGSSSVIAALKGIYAAVKGTLNTRALSSGTDSVTALISGTVATSQTQLPATLGAKTTAGSLSVTLPSDQAPLSVTSSGGALALDSSIQALTNAVKATIGITGTVWFDSTVTPPVYYVRRETVNEGTGAYSVTWENPDGTTATPTVANLKSVVNAQNIATENVTYSATSSGTGYASGDVLIHTFGVDTQTTPATLAYSFWFNAGPSTSGVMASAPTAGTYTNASSSAVSVTSSVLPTGAATESGNLATIATNTGNTTTQVTAVNTNAGTIADTAWTGAGSGTMNAILKAIYGKLAGTLVVSGTVSLNGGNATAVKVDGSAVTQPISAAALPLPTGAALESGGNLASIATSSTTTANQVTSLNTAQGAKADAAYTGTGSGSIIAVLKGIYAGVVGVSNIRPLTSATDSVAAVVSGSVSVKNTDVSGTGALTTTAQTLTLALTGHSTAIVSLSGTWTGTVQILGLLPDGSTLQVLAGEAIGGGAISSPSIPTNGTFRVHGLAGYSSLVVKPATLTSGSVNVAAVASMATQASEVYQLNPANLQVTVGAALPTGSNTIGAVTGAAGASLALETGGNLASINSNAGTVNDTAWTGSGIGTINSVLKAVYSKLAGTLTVSGTVSLNGGNATAVKTDGSAVTQPISAAALPLPTGAASETGHLATIDAVQGTVADTAYAGSGSATVVAALKGIYAKLSSGIPVTGTFWQATQPVSATSLPLPTGAAQETGGNLATTATQATALNTVTGTTADAAWTGSGSGTVVAVLKAMYGKLAGGVAVTGTFWQATQPVSAASLPLPSGAATETGNLATISTNTGAVNTATGTQADAAYTTGAGSVISLLKGLYTKLAGTLTVSGTVTVGSLPALPAGSNAIGTVSVSNFPATQAVSATALPLPTNAAQETGGNLAAVATATGTSADTAWTGTGNSTVVSALKAIYNKLNGTVAVTGTFYQATQPISAASLPLPTGAALETGGNLATTATQVSAVNAVQGTVADTAWSGTGNGTVVAVLKAMYGKLAGGVAVTGTFWQATQPVSAVSLPLPTGAALETGGNLATTATQSTTTATQTTALNTVTGTQADAAWTGTGNGTVVSVLKAMYGKLAGGVAVTGTFYQATQPISAAALPLPTGAATETGRLASIDTVQGTVADTAWAGSGNGTVVATLKGIYTKLAGALSVSPTISSTSGAITAVNANLGGAATAGSAVAVTLNGASTLVVQVSAISSTTLVLQVTEDGTNWITVGGTPFQNVSTDVLVASITATGIYQADVAGFAQARITSTAGTSATISALQATASASSITTVSNSLPAGSNAIGSVSVSNFPATQAVSMAAVPLPTGAAIENGGNLAAIATATGTTADAAWGGSGASTLISAAKAIYTKLASTLTVSSAQLPAALGQTTMAASLPVALASNQTAIPVKNQDGAGNSITSISDGYGQIGLTTAIGATNFATSVGNSTTTQLAAAATFGGAIESTVNQQALSVMLTTDQPGTLTIVQYADAGGTRTVSTWPFTIAANVPFSRSFTLNGDYVKVTFLNSGASATTTLNLKTQYGTLQPSTQNGNLPIALNEVNGASLALGQTTSAASLPVTIASDSSQVAANASLTAINTNLSGVATANSAVAVNLNGCSTLAIQVTAISGANLTLQGTVDGVNWVSLTSATTILNVTTGTYNLNISATGLYQADVSGFLQARISQTAGTSATVYLRAISGPSRLVAIGQGLPAGANGIGAVGINSVPGLTKGTQGTSGFMVQELKDAGRNLTNYFMALPIISSATETLQSLNGWKGGTAVTATTTPAVVTTGKIYRITRIVLTYTAVATAGFVLFRLRANTAGTVLVTSPLVNTWQVGVAGATAGFVQTVTLDFPDGMEFAAGTGIGLTVQGYSATAVATAVGYAHAEITGYEY